MIMANNPTYTAPALSSTAPIISIRPISHATTTIHASTTTTTTSSGAATAVSTTTTSTTAVAGTSASFANNITTTQITTNQIQPQQPPPPQNNFLNTDSRWIFTPDKIANSPSFRYSKIKPEQELAERQNAALFITDLGQRLKVNQLCINTAIIFMHRFYMIHSFNKFHRNVRIVATACLFFACKVEEQPRRLKDFIDAVHNLIHKTNAPMNTTSEEYRKRCDEITVLESCLLQTLGFNVLINHAHTMVIKTCQMIKASRDLAEAAYLTATNSLILTNFCVRYSSEKVACFCIYLGCKWTGLKIPISSEGTEWYKYVNHEITQQELEEIMNEYLNIYQNCPQKVKRKLGQQTRNPAEIDSKPPVASTPLPTAAPNPTPQQIQQQPQKKPSTSFPPNHINNVDQKPILPPNSHSQPPHVQNTRPVTSQQSNATFNNQSIKKEPIHPLPQNQPPKTTTSLNNTLPLSRPASSLSSSSLQSTSSSSLNNVNKQQQPPPLNTATKPSFPAQSSTPLPLSSSNQQRPINSNTPTSQQNGHSSTPLITTPRSSPANVPPQPTKSLSLNNTNLNTDQVTKVVTNSRQPGTIAPTSLSQPIVNLTSSSTAALNTSLPSSNSLTNINKTTLTTTATNIKQPNPFPNRTNSPSVHSNQPPYHQTNINNNTNSTSLTQNTGVSSSSTTIINNKTNNSSINNHSSNSSFKLINNNNNNNNNSLNLNNTHHQNGNGNGNGSSPINVPTNGQMPRKSIPPTSSMPIAATSNNASSQLQQRSSPLTNSYSMKRVNDDISSTDSSAPNKIPKYIVENPKSVS